MMSLRATIAGAAALLFCSGAAGQAQTGAPPQRGVPHTVGELAEICAIGPDSAEYTAASYFCRGFLAGVGQYHGATHPVGRGPQPIFCVPSPPPTLREAAAGFVTWAKANPQHAGEAAVDGLMRYANTTWPCPPEPRAARRGRSTP